MKHFASYVVLGAFCLFCASQTRAQHAVADHRPSGQERCAEASVEVIAAAPDERQLVCAAVTDALQLLGRCQIFMLRPLDIRIADEVRNPLGVAIFGMFDPNSERVWITRYDRVSLLARGTPFGEIPLREFFKSLVVHEIIHGVMHQNAKRRLTSRSAHEYPAFALQIASLPESARDAFLGSIRNGRGTDHFMFNDIILSWDPFFFAARAYAHYSAAPNGCAYLISLLNGDEFAFIANLSLLQ
jgi:hypothetical protein